jgi:hypothetical protein
MRHLLCWFRLLHLIFTFFSVLVSALYMHYHNFYCTLSCYLLLIHPDLRYIYSCSYSDIHAGCPVIKVSYFLGTQQSRCLLPPHPQLRTEIDPVSKMLCSLEYRTMGIVQKPSNPNHSYLQIYQVLLAQKEDIYKFIFSY